MQITFDTNGNDKQKEVCKLWVDPVVADIAYGGSKGSGKSYLGCSLIFGDALMYEATNYFIARKKLNDIRKFTIPSIHEVFNHWGITSNYYSFNGQDNYFKLYNDSRVYLLEAKYLPSDPQYYRFGSMQMTRGWIEEAGEFEEAAKNNLNASIGRWKNDVYNLTGKLLQTCNPSKNYLYRDYYMPSKKGTIPEWRKFIQALPSDNKKLPKGYLENLQRTLTVNEKERLLYGNWEYDDDPAALIEYIRILDIFSNSFVNEGERFITADIARFGRDKTVIGVWSGFRLIKIVTIPKNKVTEAANAIKDLQEQYFVPMSNIIVDEDGVGGGVVDILECNGFVNNSSPLDNPETKEPENYRNLKSQMYYALAKKINEAGIFVACDDSEIKDCIIQELEQVKQHDMDKDTTKAVLPKEKIKELLGRSPDYADMIMMRMWFEYRFKFEFSIG